MGKITPKCKGCARLLHAYDPLCTSCEYQSNYVVRTHNFGIEKEMELLGINPKTMIPKGSYADYSLSRWTMNEIFNTISKEGMNYSMLEQREELFTQKIEKVIFNDPATIVYWKDGSKTIVKCENEKFDPEKGLSMAISKKALGNQGNYYETFKKWLPKEKESDEKLKEEAKPDVCAGYDNEVLPYGGNKNRCTGTCQVCCPVDKKHKSYAAKVCKTKCNHYKDAFDKD